jgi:hypothetical protein
VFKKERKGQREQWKAFTASICLAHLSIQTQIVQHQNGGLSHSPQPGTKYLIKVN